MATNASNSSGESKKESKKPVSRRSARKTEPPPLEKKDSIFKFFTVDLELLRNVLRPLLYGFLNVNITGTEHVAEKGNGLIVSNYSGPIDALLSAIYFPRPVTFLATSELFNLKQRLQKMYDEFGTITGLPAFWRMGRPFIDMMTFMIGDGLKTQMLEWQAVPLAPGTDALSQKDRVRRLLDDGHIVIIFSEGTSPGTESATRDFVAGLALEAKCPVYPTLIDGTDHALEIGRVLTGKLFSQKIRFAIGEAVRPEDFPNKGSDLQKAVELGKRIRGEVEDLRVE